MYGSGREALPNVREWPGSLPDGWETRPNVREELGDPPGCLGVVGRSTRMSGCGREVLPDVR